MLLLIVILILLFGFPSFGHFYNDGAYRNYGFGLGGLVLLVLVILLVAGMLHI
jgi:heme exporter protein D